MAKRRATTAKADQTLLTELRKEVLDRVVVLQKNVRSSIVKQIPEPVQASRNN